MLRTALWIAAVSLAAFSLASAASAQGREPVPRVAPTAARVALVRAVRLHDLMRTGFPTYAEQHMRGAAARGRGPLVPRHHHGNRAVQPPGLTSRAFSDSNVAPMSRSRASTP